MALGGRILLVTLGKLTSKNFFIYEIDYHENKKRICSVLICGPLGTQKPALGREVGGRTICVCLCKLMQQVPFRNKCFVSRCVCQGCQQQWLKHKVTFSQLWRCERVCCFLRPLLGLRMGCLLPMSSRAWSFLYICPS